MKFDLYTELAQIHKIVQRLCIKLLMFTREMRPLMFCCDKKNDSHLCRFFFINFFLLRGSAVVADFEVLFGD